MVYFARNYIQNVFHDLNIIFIYINFMLSTYSEEDICKFRKMNALCDSFEYRNAHTLEHNKKA